MVATESTFSSRDGTRLHGRLWPPDVVPKAAVLIVHGYAEHSGRYAWVAAQLAARGHVVMGFDLRGHGKSEGERAVVRSMNEYLDDVDAALLRLLDAASELPVFILGHSMGGAILSLYACARIPKLGERTRGLIAGLVFSGAVLPTAPGVRATIVSRIAILLGRLAPRWRVRGLGGPVSRDPAVVADYESDPLNYHGKMPAGLISAIVRGMKYVDAHMGELSAPMLILHGSADELTPPDGSKRLYDNAGSADKMLKVYEGLAHEILNEPERSLVLEDIANWLEHQLVKPSSRATAAPLQ